VKFVHVTFVIKFAFITWVALAYQYIVVIYIVKLLSCTASQMCYQVC